MNTLKKIFSTLFSSSFRFDDKHDMQNAFGLMIGIFVVLFGMAYQEAEFPGGYKGKETAIIAGVFMFFTLIGYCGVSGIRLAFMT